MEDDKRERGDGEKDVVRVNGVPDACIALCTSGNATSSWHR